MKPNEKKMILILVAITVLVIIIFIARKNNNEDENIILEDNNPKEEFVETLEDGTRINTSNKLAKTKKIDGLEIGNITLTEKGNESVIKATVKNTTSERKGDEFIKLTLIDKEGNTIVEVRGHLATIDPGDTIKLEIKASCDFANAYDFKVSK